MSHDVSVSLPRKAAALLIATSAATLRSDLLTFVTAMHGGVSVDWALTNVEAIEQVSLSIEIGIAALDDDSAVPSARETVERARHVTAQVRAAAAQAEGVTNALLVWRPAGGLSVAAGLAN